MASSARGRSAHQTRTAAWSASLGQLRQRSRRSGRRVVLIIDFNATMPFPVNLYTGLRYNLIRRSAEVKAVIERARQFIPGGVQHNLAFNYPFPIVVDRTEGAYLYDAKANTLTPVAATSSFAALSNGT